MVFCTCSTFLWVCSSNSRSSGSDVSAVDELSSRRCCSCTTALAMESITCKPAFERSAEKAEHK